MSFRLNRFLADDLIAQILETLFINKPIKILRSIARTGRNASSVPWVYYENQLTGDRVATFISFDELLGRFWLWLESVNLMALALFQRQAISNAVFHWVEVGELVYTEQHGWAKVIEKEISVSKKIKYFWVETESSFEKIEPCFLDLKYLN